MSNRIILIVITVFTFLSCEQSSKVKTTSRYDNVNINEKKLSENEKATIDSDTNLKSIKIEGPKRFIVKNYSNIIFPFSEQIQKVKIDPKKDTIIFLNQGSRIFFKENILEYQNGSKIEGMVDLDLREFFSKKDFLFNNLQTISNDGLLISDGMLLINATSNGEQLRLKENSQLYIRMPKKDQENFEIYRGNYNSKKQLIWTNEKPLDKDLISFPFDIINFSKSKGECSIDNKILNRLTSPRFENTYISTFEFSERLSWLMCTETHKLIEIYTKNIKKNLWEADKEVYDYMEVNYADSLTKRKFSKNILNQFDVFYKQKLKNVKKELTASEKAYRENLIDNINQKNASKNFLNNAFSISSLGWINVDRFYNIPESNKTNLIVKIPNANKENIFISIVFKRFNSVIQGTLNPQGYFTFNENKGNKKLPKGEPVILVALAKEKNEKNMFFSCKEMTITKNDTIKLVLKNDTPENIKKTISNIIK